MSWAVGAVLLLLVVCLCLFWFQDGKPGGDAGGSSQLPSLGLLSVYMAKEGASLHYGFMDVTLASMALNPTVDFILIHVVKDKDLELAKKEAPLVPYEVTIPRNFRVHVYSYSQLSDLAARRLNVDVTFTEKWSYKMAEYKPTYGQLFEEHLVSPRTARPYDWWGYADLDLVWGNISHFSHLFQSPSKFPIVHSGWRAPRGMAAFFVNEPWTRQLYREDPIYVRLLENSSYMNLDENGLSCHPENVVNGGRQSLAYFQWSALERRGRGEKVYGGKTSKTRLFLEKIDSVKWAGPVVWQAGSLRSVREYKSVEEDFPPFREIMFYHRADDGFEIPRGIPRSAWVGDMISHGFLLPYFTPLLTRFMCPRTASQSFHGQSLKELGNYRPYNPQCLAAPNSER